MTIRALLLLGGVSLALAGVASAQSVSPPAAAATPPPAPAAPLPSPAVATAPAAVHAPATMEEPGVPPQRIGAMVRASGFDPIGAPVRRGNLYLQRAIDPSDIEYRLVIDAVTGRTLSVRPMRLAGPYGGPAYRPGPYYGYPPPYRRVYGPVDYGFYGSPRPPRAVPTAHAASPQSEPQPQPHQTSRSDTAAQSQPQPSTTAKAPLPRPKPYVMEATGSILADSPRRVPAEKTARSEKTPQPPRAASQDNGAAEMPPVAPLD